MNDEEILDKLRKMLFHTQQASECGLSNNDFKEDIQALSGIIGIYEKQKAEIETLKRDFEIVDHECSRLEQEDIRKDRIIDLMASAICYELLPTDEFCISRNLNCPVVGGNRECKECIKEYFENKVKESK